MILLIFVVGLVFAVASIWAVYSYGRFAEQSRGEPSFSLPTDGARTPLMEDLHEFVASQKATTGLQAAVSISCTIFGTQTEDHGAEPVIVERFVEQGRLLAV
jgi:hypothetical protein